MKSGRVALLIVLALGVLLGPPGAGAQQAEKVPRIGVLASGLTPAVQAFKQRFRELGYLEGQNAVMEWRFYEGRADRARELATELVRTPVDILVAMGTPAFEAVRKATTEIPIVALGGTDPVGTGLVASLANPGGNVTGLTVGHPEENRKRLQLLKEAVPGLSRVAILRDSSMGPRVLKDLDEAGQALGLQVQLVEVRSTDDLEPAFRAATRGRAQAVDVPGTPLLRLHAKRLADLALKHRLPGIGSPLSAEAGLLISFGVDRSEVFRRGAGYVDRILKGTKPADLPIEQPTKFELVINRASRES